MKIVVNFRFVSLLLLGLFLSFQGAEAESVRYCEDVSKKLHLYSDSESVYRDLVLKASRRAVELVFQKELRDYDRGYFSREEIIDSMLPLIEYDEMIRKDTLNDHNAFNICVNLENVRPKFSTDKQRFAKKKIAELCHFEEAYVEQKIKEINNQLIKNLKKGNISRSIALMLNNPDNLKAQTKQQLDRYTYISRFKTDARYLSDLQCRSLHLYPIDLYVASSERMISPEISVLPPITAADKLGKKARFQLIVIQRAFNWKKGSNVDIVKQGKTIHGFKKTFKNPRFHKLSQDYLQDIVSLGMASCEGKAKRENNRAKARAKSVLGWLKDAFSEEKNINIYGVNLGKHKFSGRACKRIPADISASQRTLLLVGVMKGSDKGINLKQAIYQAMQNIAIHQPAKLPINPKDYLLFDIIK